MSGERIQESFIICEALSECCVFPSWVLIRHIYICNILDIKSNTHQKDVTELGWGGGQENLNPEEGLTAHHCRSQLTECCRQVSTWLIYIKWHVSKRNTLPCVSVSAT